MRAPRRCPREQRGESDSCACDALQLFASCVALARDAEQCYYAAHALPQSFRDVNGRLDSTVASVSIHTSLHPSPRYFEPPARPCGDIDVSDTLVG